MNNFNFVQNIQWQLNTTCNLKCKHCFLSNPNVKNTSMDYELALRIINIFKNSGVKMMGFTLREPLAYPHIYELLDYCYKQNIATNILTNGILLNDEENVRRLFEANVSTISMSLEGITEETNDYVRGKGSFRKVLKAIQNINKYRKEYNLYIPIIMHFTLNSINIEQCSNLPKFFNNLGVDILSVSEISLSGEAKNNKHLKASEELLLEGFENMIESYSKLKEKNFTISLESMTPHASLYFNLKYNLNLGLNRPKCSILSDNYTINSDGEICSCPKILEDPYFEQNYDGLSRYNVFNSNEIESFYNSISKFKEYIYDVKKAKQFKFCSNCSFYNDCTICSVVSDGLKNINNTKLRCDYYKNKIDEILDLVINNFDEYNIVIKESALIVLKDNNFEFKNLYKFGVPYKKTIELDYDEKKLLESVINKSYEGTIMKNIRNKKKSLYKIISTDCLVLEKGREKWD